MKTAVVVTIEAERATPYASLCDALRSRGPTLNLLFEQARMALDRESDTVLRDAFAGTIAVVLHDMVRGYWRAQSGSKTEWKDAGPKIAGFSLPQILAAAVDNFRHYEEWDTQKGATLTQVRSVRILAAVLGIPLKKHSKRPPFRGNVCWPVLEALASGAGYTRMDAIVREFALNLQLNRT